MSDQIPPPSATNPAPDGAAGAETAARGAQVPPPKDPPCPHKRHKRRRRIWWSVRAVLLVVAAPLVFALVAALSLIGREITAPSWVVRDVEARAGAVLAGGSLGFGSMKITIGTDLRPTLVLTDAVLRDADSAVLAQVPQITSQVSPRGVLQGRVLAQRITVQGAQIQVLRAADGSVALSFDQGAMSLGSGDSLFDLLNQFDSQLDGGTLEALRQVTATGMILNYTDARAGQSWVLDDGRVSLDLRGGQTELRADLTLLSGRDYVTNAQFSYASPRGSRAADLSLVIRDVTASDIASQSPLLNWLSVLDAPISGALRGQLDATGKLLGVNATLQIAQGELRPSAATRPIPFQSAQTYFSFDPDGQKLTFNQVEIDSDWGRVAGSAQAYLREFDGAWPAAFLGQVQLTTVQLAPQGFYDAPLVFDSASADFRMRLDPFTLDIGQAVLIEEEAAVRASGQVQATSEGWSVALDLAAREMATERVLALWPPAQAEHTRAWLAANVQGGVMHNIAAAFRVRQGAAPVIALTADYSDAQVRYMASLPPIEAAAGSFSLIGRRLGLTLDSGFVTAPQGGRIDMAGSSMVIPQTGAGSRAAFDLAMDSSITAAMAVLNEEPFNVLGGSDLPVSFAQGRAVVRATVETPLGQGVTGRDRIWQATADLRDLRSDALVPNRTLTASALRLQADAASMVVSGPAQLGELGGTARFSRALGAGSAGTARLEADIALSPAVLEALNIGLPRGMVTGRGTGQLVIDLGTPAAPRFRLTSNLQGIGLSLAGLGWAKGANTSGALTVAGQLGEAPRIDELSISAPGLQTTGTVQLAASGGLERAAFERVRLGGWLDAPVVLIGRGQGRPAAIQIAGGSLDLRAANFGSGTGGGGGAAMGPLDVALDSLQITGGISLQDFRGQFTSNNGLTGDFSALVNGGTSVQGTLVPMAGRSAVRVRSNDAGGVMRSAGLLRSGFGGSMDLTLTPSRGEGSFDGTLVGRDLRVRDAPALASLLDAISVVGLLNQMGGQGLLFSDVEAQFRVTPSQIIVTRSSAIGPGLGLSMDGIYAQASQSMDFQGVISPFYLINGLGSVLTRPGEGLIGFNFNLRGPVDSPQVLVNPLSALTPGMFREIFRRPPPTVGQ